MKNINSNSQKNLYNNNNSPKFHNLLYNIHKYKLYPAPTGFFFEKPKINSYLNFTSLEAVLLKDKKAIIGDGSFSKVFLYQHKKTKVKYAIKKMNLKLVSTKTNNKNIIINEINIQSKISHPNIIKLYNYFIDKDKLNYFLIMEYASKGTLFDHIRLKEGFDETYTFYYFIQAVNAIYFLHRNQIIHRDLKPENLLINHENILKLCDFGWSVYLHNNKRETFCGTVEYMAPEIIKNQAYDFSIDVWSLGVLLYELIHSYSPFVENDLNYNKIEKNIISKQLIFKKGVSNECKDLIRKLLVKNAENRIKIQDIYQHPFVLRYVNMINHYIKITQVKKDNTNDNNKINVIINNNINNKRKKEIINNKKKEENDIDGSQQSFSEFDTIPNEPEIKKMPVNFNIIIKKFTKINNKNKKEKISNNNKIKSIKTLIDRNIIKETNHKKSLSLNNLQVKDIIINEGEKKSNIQKQINNHEKSKKNENKQNLGKLSIKEDSEEKQNIKHQTTLGNLKPTLMDTYNNNLIKTNYKKNNKNKNRIRKILNSHIKTNNSTAKKPLITSYKVKSKNKNLGNKKLVSNFTSTNLHKISKLNNTGKIKKIPNCKSISFINFNSNNKNKSFHNFSLYSNSNKKNNKESKSKINKKRNILIKHINTLNKKSNYSYNDINKINSREHNQKKLTLNLSNVNVINVYNNSSSNELNSNSFNVSKIIQKINTFFIRDKTKKQYIIRHEKKNINYKSQNTDRQTKKKTSKVCLKLKKSKPVLMNHSESQKKKSQNNIKQTRKYLLNFSNIKQSKEKNLIKSSRNIISKNNQIPPLNLCIKKK